MSSAPMNAVKERKECSLARREAGAESKMVEDINLREKLGLCPCGHALLLLLGAPNLKSNLGNQ